MLTVISNWSLMATVLQIFIVIVPIVVSRFVLHCKIRGQQCKKASHIRKIMLNVTIIMKIAVILHCVKPTGHTTQ